jgi:hypothetical protein
MFHRKPFWNGVVYVNDETGEVIVGYYDSPNLEASCTEWYLDGNLSIRYRSFNEAYKAWQEKQK